MALCIRYLYAVEKLSEEQFWQGVAYCCADGFLEFLLLVLFARVIWSLLRIDLISIGLFFLERHLLYVVLLVCAVPNWCVSMFLEQAGADPNLRFYWM